MAARPSTIIRNGIDQLLPDQIELIHGPGCPVCVTPLETIDRALAIAARPDVIFCSFGEHDPGSGIQRRLVPDQESRGDIRIVYSPLDAVKIAQENPDKQVVFFGVGFETTAPANAMTVKPANNRASTTSRCWSRTYWCRRRSARSWTRPVRGCELPHSGSRTAPSWACRNTSRWWSNTQVPHRRHRVRNRWMSWRDPPGGSATRTGPGWSSDNAYPRAVQPRNSPSPSRW